MVQEAFPAQTCRGRRAASILPLPDPRSYRPFLITQPELIVARTSPPSKGKSPAPLAVILGIVALVAVAVLGYRMFSGGAGAAAREPVEVATTPAELSRVQGISMGRADAPVVIYEFADYQCPHCSDWVSLVEPLIKERLVDTGMVRYVFYDFPLGGAFRHSFLASRAGRCANEQNKFWEYHNLIFGRQQTWSGMSDPAEFFVELAGQAGLNEEQFQQCLYSDKYAREVTLSRRLGDSLGVQGTPSLFVNGERLPEIPSFQELERIVRAKAGQPAAPADSAAAPAAGL